MFAMKKTIKVVAAIIENEKQEILCALRSPKMSIPNMWEFPGGKVEEGKKLKSLVWAPADVPAVEQLIKEV